MTTRHTTLSLVTTALVFGIAHAASAHDPARSAQAASETYMQAQSSEGPTWHVGDRSIYDTEVGSHDRAYYNETAPTTYYRAPEGAYYRNPEGAYYRAPETTTYYVPPAHDDLLVPDDLTNDLTPSEASRITGHADSAAGPARTGSDEQPGNMGPNSTKGQ